MQKEKLDEDDLINLDAGAKHRYLQLIALEESGEESQFDDADFVHEKILDAPVITPSVPPVPSKVLARRAARLKRRADRAAKQSKPAAPPVSFATPQKFTIVWEQGIPVRWSDGQIISPRKKPRKVSK